MSGPLEKGFQVSNEGYSPSTYSFDKVSAIGFCLEEFSIIIIIIIIKF